jgi:hypothetical protein
MQKRASALEHTGKRLKSIDILGGLDASAGQSGLLIALSQP